jgi:regulator of sirC expression with transglutaminase-like and TPR domain
MLRLAKLALLAALALTARPVHSDEAPTQPAPETKPADAPVSVAELTERVRPAVVVITSSGRDGRQSNVGTGFVVSADGLVATNFHVVGEGRAVSVQLADGRRAEVTAIHAFDRALDLAVLRVDAKNLKALDLGNSDEVRQGQAVIALGNPHGLKHSVAAGVVSGVREMEGRPMLQLDIAIEPGNSGGPLVDMQGRVQGIMTMKSLVTPRLGFALASKLLKPLLDKPNPIPMSRWLTIGALDPRDWKPLFGARWQQRAGRITVDEPGEGFGGRSLCLSQQHVPERPYEMCVTVRLDDESGAAGLAFCADGGDRHYGFYPSGGGLRLTRFDGHDVTTWNILYDHASNHYVSGQWNTLRVRLEEGKILCFVNDQPVVELADSGLTSGAVGLVKFRNTKAQFKNFKLGAEVPRSTIPAADSEQIAKRIADLPAAGPLDDELVRDLADDAARASTVLRNRALELDNQARQLRRLAEAAHERGAINDLVAALAAEDDKIDLFRSGLLIARLDNEEVDVDAYCAELERMAEELKSKLAADADDKAKLDALRKYLFEENGFHGSRGDFYNRANSYLNEVLDDREGLPITLSIVYLELAHRLGLDVVGLGLPGHFVVGYRPAEGDMQLIDVFEGAASVARDVAEERVRDAVDDELSDEALAKYFQPIAKRAIITRMLTNLLGVANSYAAGHRYLNALLALDPDQAMYRFMRAEIRMQLDDPPSARGDIEWLLEREPVGINLERVRQHQATLDRQ